MEKRNIKNDYQVNFKIRAPELRVIAADGENIGVIKTQEALRLAREADLDLVVISAGATPPVAKILDFNKYLYEERKKSSASKAKSKKSELKEFVFGPTIDMGDLNSKIARAVEFINDGNRVRVTIKMKGRENEFPQVGFDRIKKFTEGLAEVAKLEGAPRHQGNMINATYLKK